MRFTRHRPFLVFVRVREGALFASVSARPHPKAAAQDRSDTVGRRRALPPWRAYNGPRQVTCAWLQVVLRHRVQPDRPENKAALAEYDAGRLCIARSG
jgi:hypothetical protein